MRGTVNHISSLGLMEKFGDLYKKNRWDGLPRITEGVEPVSAMEKHRLHTWVWKNLNRTPVRILSNSNKVRKTVQVVTQRVDEVECPATEHEVEVQRNKPLIGKFYLLNSYDY